MRSSRHFAKTVVWVQQVHCLACSPLLSYLSIPHRHKSPLIAYQAHGLIFKKSFKSILIDYSLRSFAIDPTL